MAATEITTTPQNIVGDFDLIVRGNPTTNGKSAVLQKALGSGGTNFVTCYVSVGQASHFVANTGTNAYRLAEAVAGVTVEFNQ